MAKGRMNNPMNNPAEYARGYNDARMGKPAKSLIPEYQKGYLQGIYDTLDAWEEMGCVNI